MPADCDDIGTIGAFTGVSSTTILDDFERDWNKLGDGATYTGFWFVAKDDAENETLVPDTGAWGYETDVCSDTDALHITGSGFSTWGASFDAQLMAAVAAVDVSEFTGIAFWARSTGSNQLKLAISDADAGNGTTPIERPTTIFLGEQWEQHLVPFPAGATMDQATVVHLVVVAGASFDLWLDDVSFYVAE
jgi:hypothetical protein